MDLNTLMHRAAYGTRGLTLENLDDDLPEGGDASIGSFAEYADAHGGFMQDLNVAAEAIREYGVQLKGLIERKELTPVMLGIIRQAAQDRAEAVGFEIALPAMESVEVVDIEAQGKIALEGFRNVILNMFQADVLAFKHMKDVISDLFRGASGMLAKYEKKTLENKREWNQVKGKLENESIRVAFTGLTDFLITDSANTDFEYTHFVSAVRADQAVSEFVLREYPKRILEQLRTVSKLLRGAKLDSDEGVMKLGKDVEKLKSPVELFDKKYLETELFGMRKFVVPKSGKGRATGGLDRLSELANSKAIQLPKSGLLGGHGHLTAADRQGITQVAALGAGHIGAAVAGHYLGPASGAHKANGPIYAGVGNEKGNFVVRTQEIGSIFDAADTYLESVRIYLGLEREILRAIEDLENTIKTLEDKGGDEKGEGDQHMNAVYVFEQVLGFARVLTRAATTPSGSEVARSLRASKYLNYLGLRAIFNARKKES
jgi:hypothetical protein